MNEYKIVYMAAPISEIPKIVYVVAEDEVSAIGILERKVATYDLVSIDVVD